MGGEHETIASVSLQVFEPSELVEYGDAGDLTRLNTSGPSDPNDANAYGS